MLETYKANGIGRGESGGYGNDYRRHCRTEGVEHFDPLVMINPEVLDHEGLWALEEGCLSLPELRDEVERPERIRVGYRDLHFDQKTIEVQGLLGRVIQHELDHLNGVLFIDHLGSVRRRLLRGRLNKIQNGNVEVTYEVAPLQDPAAHTA
jgi:peptide deformylase